MDRQQIMQIASQNPQVQQAVEMAKQQVSQMDLNPQLIDEVIQVLEHVMDSPNDYPAVRAAAIRDGFVEEDDLPAEFDPIVIASLLIVFYGLKDQAGQQQQAAFARGGLARLAAQGRGGDTMLAHINPQEAEMLRRMGGSGGINPNTGLHEFKGGGLMNIVKTVAPIALAIAAPGLGMAMSAALGAGIGAIGGGGIKGALMGAALGGLGAGAGGALGGAANSAMGTTLSAGAQNVLGSSLIGGTIGQVTGQGFGKGAVMGAAGGMASNAIGGMAGTGNSALNAGIRAGGATTGNLLTVGADAKTALKGGALAGLMAGGMQGYQNANAKPSATVTNNLGLKSTGSTEGIQGVKLDTSGDVTGGGLNQYAINGSSTALNPDMTVDYSFKAQPAPSGLETAAANQADQLYTPPQTLAQQTGADTTNIGMNKATGYGALALAGLAAASAPPPEAQAAIDAMSPAQKEYFNRPSYVWDWDKMSADAASQGMDLGTFMANNWNDVSGGAYKKKAGIEQSEVAAARGGYIHGYAEGGEVPPMSNFRLAVKKLKLGIKKDPLDGNPGVDNPTAAKPAAWDWNKIKQDADAAGKDLGTYLATNWNGISGGQYNQVAMARGGALNALAQGGGSGRADTIHAKLSDGEYVIDAETVALLGDGSTKEGAKRLDEMRKKLRMQKGKTLAKGGFSPAAKSPLAYMKGAA